MVVCEHFLRKRPNFCAYKNEYLTHYASSIEILVLGSSHAFFGIDPSIFSDKAFNAAFVSQSLKYDHFIFTKFYDQMDSLRFLVMPISYFSLVTDLEGSEEDWRIKYYSIYYGCKYHRFEPKYNLMIYDATFKEIIESVSNKNEKESSSWDLGFGRQKLEECEGNLESTGVFAARRHTVLFDTNILAKNLFYLKDIIHKSAERNVIVILVTTPTYKTYYDNLDAIQSNIMKNECESLSTNYDNVMYIDLMDDKRFFEQDFCDADHLNEIGATKLTMLIQHSIDSLKFQVFP